MSVVSPRSMIFGTRPLLAGTAALGALGAVAAWRAKLYTTAAMLVVMSAVNIRMLSKPYPNDRQAGTTFVKANGLVLVLAAAMVPLDYAVRTQTLWPALGTVFAYMLLGASSPMIMAQMWAS